MKIERLSQDKIRIFLTFDDLMERGIQKEDMWREIPKVHDLFSEMMDQAYSELGFDATGPLAVEVFALPAQGMVVIVTKGKIDANYMNDHLEEELDDDVYEMEVTLEQSDLISYTFTNFEHLIGAARLIHNNEIEDGILFAYEDKWILQLEPMELDESKYQALIAVLSEFGEANSMTTEFLEEYGKVVMPSNAIKTLCHYFK